MKIPQNSVTTLRVLTKKSKIGFGRNADLTVADVIIIDKSYIAWMYYNMANISLRDDILEELRMEKVDKPGKNEELFRSWCRAESEKYSDEERFRGAMKKKRIKANMEKAERYRERNAATLSKGQMQAANHGKMKLIP